MHAHGIDVLDGADDDGVPCLVRHHLHLEFLPADEGFLYEDLMDGALIECPFDEGKIILFAFGN